MLSVSQILLNPSKVAIIGDITSREVRGLAMGAFRTAGDIGFFVGPTIGGVLDRQRGRALAFLCRHYSLPSFSHHRLILLTSLQTGKNSHN